MATFDITNNAFSDPIVNGGKDLAAKIPSAVILVLVGIVIIRILSWIFQLFIGLVRLPKGLKGILVSIVDAILWIFLAIITLQALGLGNIALVFSGSLAALGLALAAGGSNLASDILGGVFLAQDRDFNVGDHVIAGENKTEGIIEGMDMRRTRIRDNEGKLHVMPNSVIERKEWVLLNKKKDLKS